MAHNNMNDHNDSQGFLPSLGQAANSFLRGTNGRVDDSINMMVRRSGNENKAGNDHDDAVMFKNFLSSMPNESLGQS